LDIIGAGISTGWTLFLSLNQQHYSEQRALMLF